MVIDRGAAPFLTNLEAFCDGNFVTHVQVEESHAGCVIFDSGGNLVKKKNMSSPHSDFPRIDNHDLFCPVASCLLTLI